MKTMLSDHPNPVIAEDISRILSADLDWPRFAGGTVLVTGASGFLPAYLVETLMALRHHPAVEGLDPPRIVGLVRDEGRGRARFAHHLANPGFTLLVQNVCDPLPDDLRPDFILHAASQASPKFYRDDPVGTIRPNTAGTERLLARAAKCATRKVLFFSSSEIYGRLQAGAIPTAEHETGMLDPMDPRACYAESKRLGETTCAAWYRQHGVPATIVRPFHIYGPGMRLDDGRVFADFVADCLAGRDITLLSAGTATRSFCYLAEATEGFFRILLQGEPATAYNLGNPDGETSIAELAEIIAGLFPEKGLKVNRAARDTESGYIPSAIERSCPDIARLQALGWRPAIGVAEGFRRTIESFMAEPAR